MRVSNFPSSLNFFYFDDAMLYAEIKKSENKTKKEEEKLTFTFHFTNEIITVCLCKQFQPFFYVHAYLVREAV